MPDTMTYTAEDLSYLNNSRILLRNQLDRLKGVLDSDIIKGLETCESSMEQFLKSYHEACHKEESARGEKLDAAWEPYYKSCPDMYLPLDVMPEDILINVQDVMRHKEILDKDVNSKFAVFAIKDKALYVRFFDHSLTALQIAIMFSESRTLLDDYGHYFFEGVSYKRNQAVQQAFDRITNEAGQESEYRDDCIYFQMNSGS